MIAPAYLACLLLLLPTIAACSNPELQVVPTSVLVQKVVEARENISCNRGDLGLTAVTAESTPEQLALQARGFADYNFNAVRLTIQWPFINSTPGVYDWAATDELVDAFHGNGISILGVITWAPTWAVPPENQLVKHPAPADPLNFANFAAAVATRYGDRIKTWEIWNEPNLGSTFGPRVNPELYVAMLATSYMAMKRIDPAFVILSGASAPTIDNGIDLSPQSFFARLYELGANKFFDGLSMHPYSTFGPLSSYNGPVSSAVAINEIRELMVRHGDAEKKIWFTELGFPTGGPQGMPEPMQAERLVDAVNYLRSLDFCGAIFLFDFRDVQTGSEVSDFNYGLLRSDFSPKPSMAAIQQTN